MMEDYKHLVDGISLSKDDVGELEMWNWAVEDLAEKSSMSVFSLKFGYGNNTGTSKKERVFPCLRAISAFYSDNGIEEGILDHEWEDIFTLKIFPLNRNIKEAVHEARELFQNRMIRLKADGLVKTDYDTEWIFRGCFGSFIWRISEILYERINSLHDGDFYKSGLFSKYHIVALDYADNMNLNDFNPKREYDDYDVEAMFFKAGLYDNVDEEPNREVYIKEDRSVEIIEYNVAINMMVNKLYNDVKSIVYANRHRPLREAKKEIEELAYSTKNQKKELSYLYACAVMEWYIKHH